MNWRTILAWEVTNYNPGDRIYCDVAALGPQYHATIKKVKHTKPGYWIKLQFDSPVVQQIYGPNWFWQNDIHPLY